MMNWLKNIRVEANLKQETVARKAKISQASYSNIEKGKRKPSCKTAKLIAEALNFNWVKFYEDEKQN